MSTEVEKILAHHGIKGMKWGFRKEHASGSPSRAQKKIEKGDKKFAKRAQSSQVTFAIFNDSVPHVNAKLRDINDKPAYKNGVNHNPELNKKYTAEVQTMFMKELQRSADNLGTNPSGTQKYHIIPKGNHGGWDITTIDVTHADNSVLFSVQPKFDSTGLITGFEFIQNQMMQSDEFISEFLEHHGIKGMKWGVRRSSGESSTGRKRKTHPVSEDHQKSHAALTKAKKHGTSSLSNTELQAIVNRMNLEQNFSRLNKGTVRKGEDHIKTVLAVGTTLASVHSLATSPFGKTVGRAAGKLLVKHGKTALKLVVR